MSSKKINILYIYSGETEFKKRDEIIFSDNGNLRKLNLLNINDFFNPKNISLIKWCDVIVIWFASYHALPFVVLNQIFNKKIYIIAGGYDVANVPEINYGLMASGFRKILGKWLLNTCK